MLISLSKKNRMNKGLLLVDTCHCTFKGYSLEEVNLYLMMANELALLEKKRDESVRNKRSIFMHKQHRETKRKHKNL
jgi:hypothetical protein